MNLRAKVTGLIEGARRYPKSVVSGLFVLFFLNYAFFIYSLRQNPVNDKLVIFLYLLFPVWPIALITFGILRLLRGTTTDESEIKRRREVTLRYFAIGTLLLLIILVAYWRYVVERGTTSLVHSSITLVIPILILSGLFVTITWHWVKYSGNKLSAYINKAPTHYLVSGITFVITLICYIAYSDVNDLIDFFTLNHRAYSAQLTRVMIVFQSLTWIGIFAGIGAALLGYLRPSDALPETGDQANDNEKRDRLPASATSPDEEKDEELVSTAFQPDTLKGLISTVALSTGRIEKFLNQSPSISLPLTTGDILVQRAGLIRGRLIGELKALTKRGNLNLTIGILTTIAAASALSWGLFITQPPPNETEVAGLLRHYLPRISFAIFIEVFSFFFLRLYKTSLEDIKYYHNELTNLDSKLLALEIAAAHQMPEALSSILLGLLNTDRNFILKSGESTVELERIKTEQQSMRTVLDAIAAKIPDLKEINKPTK